MHSTWDIVESCNGQPMQNSVFCSWQMSLVSFTGSEGVEDLIGLGGAIAKNLDSRCVYIRESWYFH